MFDIVCLYRPDINLGSQGDSFFVLMVGADCWSATVACLRLSEVDFSEFHQIGYLYPERFILVREKITELSSYRKKSLKIILN